ncbi:CvpA family protein [Acutalibacter muris]|mgnify:CR=1 FL=1|uniref:CvpA family protein n=2 Tax=Acutalibacter muris TaxID=1796620 RepID=A0A1Z2XNS0_9FIRM|nr:CvpA family protein [Acutalibacter muris]ANU53238.1 hypothetical protein A4V00_03905 [Hungateiclostridiaceae bacterium KB18]ASB40089.1 hypothetical protein ADH66_05090 [Acutalibacter muris]MCI9193011.1 hypothetical protein [Acutalibacter muris]QQR29378.1 CvpA family protein [Acutalibacter muris]
MQYCMKCRHLSEDGPVKCPNCKSRKLRPAGEGDMVFLCKADMYAAGRINEALMGAGIQCRLENAGSAYFNFDSETSPTDQNIFVPYETVDRAEETAARAMREVESEREPEEGGDDRPGMKRIVGEVLSVLAFLVLIMLAVYGADGLANWLKGLVGM